MDDLKGIISQEIKHNELTPLLEKKVLPLENETNIESKPNRVKVSETKVFDDSLKENQIDSINIPTDNTDIKQPEPKKNNLLFNLFNK